MPAIRNDWTIDELRQLPDDGNRYELVDGVLLVSPAPSWRHQFAVTLLCELLQAWLREHPIGVAGVAPYDFELSRGVVLEPDVFVIPNVRPGEAPRIEYKRPLILAAEVLSPSTERNDRTVKRPAYQSARVPEHWIIDLDGQTFERWRPDDARPEVLIDRLEWLPSTEHPPFVLDVQEYFRIVEERVAAT